MMRGCEDDVCGEATIHFRDENGNIIHSINTGVESCIDGGEGLGMKCSMDGSECEDKKCCSWWQIFGC